MPHQTVYNPDTWIIETKFQGITFIEELREVMEESALLTLEHDCYRWLGDHTGATTSLSTSDIYELPRLLAQAAAPLGTRIHKIKRAAVSVDNMEGARFAEVASANRSQRFKCFATLEEARTWLKEEP